MTSDHEAAVERGRAAMERRYYAGFSAKPESLRRDIEATYRGGSQNTAKIVEADPRRVIATGFLVGIIAVFGLAYLFITQ